MRSLCALLVGGMALGGVAQAQTSAEPAKYYVEGVAQAAFGSVGSQSYGVEGGMTVWKNVQVFAEFGRVRDVSPSDLGDSAQLIANYLSQTQPSPVSVSVKEPATFGAVGAKYLIPMTFYKLEPYVLAGVGAAKLTKNVSFVSGGTDITGSLAGLGVALGSDLSGSFTKAMFVLGGGVTWPVWQQVVIDVQIRFNHVGAEDQDPSSPTVLTKGTSFGRFGIGVGYRF